MRYPGEVWFLPPDAREEGDPKPRRHVLLNACDEADPDGVGVFAFASTQFTEASFGAAYLLFDPAATSYGQRGNAGFTRATYIYPCRLVPAAITDFQRMMGRLIDEITEVRLRLRQALGFGMGTASSGLARGSWRGRIVQLAGLLAAEIDSQYALVVTEAGYSNHQRYQTVIPLLDGGEWSPGPGDIVIPAGAAWIERALPELESAFLAVPEVFSAFHPSEIVRDTGAVVDEPLIEEVEDTLRTFFGL